MTIFSTNPGKYRQRLTIQSRQDVRQPNGGYKPQWVDLFTNVGAEVLTGAGSEPIAADAKQSKDVARINFPWLPGIESTMRILFEGKVYDITSLEGDSTLRREIRLRVQAGLTDGR